MNLSEFNARLKESNTKKGGGFSFVHILTIIFVIAKLTGHFNYSWWVVFSPLWGMALALIAIFIIIFIVLTISHIISKK